MYGSRSFAAGDRIGAAYSYDGDRGRRWLSRDPLGEYAGTNLYDYVGNQPISRIDPDGRIWWAVAGGIIGGAINGYKHWDDWRNGCISDAQFAGSVGTGFAAGFLSTLAPGVGSAIALGAATSFGNSVADQEITTGHVNLGEAANEAGTGAVVGGAGALGAKAAFRVLNDVKVIGRVAKDGAPFGFGYGGLYDSAKQAGEITGAVTNAAGGLAGVNQSNCPCKK